MRRLRTETRCLGWKGVKLGGTVIAAMCNKRGLGPNEYRSGKDAFLVRGALDNDRTGGSM